MLTFGLYVILFQIIMKLHTLILINSEKYKLLFSQNLQQD